MKKHILTEGTEAILLSRLDLVAFIGAFIVGSSLYAALHFAFRVHQMIVAAVIVGVDV